MIKIFISHSSNDTALAENLIQLLREATNLPQSDIRCTSVDGYKLKGGANTNEVLKSEAINSDVFLAILSKTSLKSIYVVFELGARWSTDKTLIPMLAPDISPTELKAPLSSLHCPSLSNQADLHQVVHDISKQLGLTLNSPASYQKYIAKMSNIQSENMSIESVPIISRASFTPYSTESEESVLKGIKKQCSKDYPIDFSTQKHVINEQLNSWKKLCKLTSSDVPKDVFTLILETVKENYPTDYSTQLHVYKEEISSWKDINLN